MTICSYLPFSGSDAGERESEARIYRGNDDGTFTLDREITVAANSAVAEKTIPIILDFVGAGRPAADYMEAWQTAQTFNWMKMVSLSIPARSGQVRDRCRIP